MTRRLTSWFSLFTVVALCLVTAQSRAAPPRIGVLSPGTPESAASVLAGLREGLRQHGYVEGTSVAIEYRFAAGQLDRLPALARELIGMNLDVLVTQVTQASIAARDNTKSIPIVMAGVADPVGTGLVASLSRPGGNVTGTSGLGFETAVKAMELLREVVPGLRRVAVLWNPTNQVFQRQLLRQTETTAQNLGIQLQVYEAPDLESIERAFLTMRKDGISALNVTPDPAFIQHAARIAELAKRERLPSVSGSFIEYADVGGLIAYGPNYAELARAAGGYVAKILKGAKPGDLPIEQATKFDLVVNLKTAKQLDIVIPPSLRLRADRVIE